MVQSLCILGRQPRLSVTELESLFGSDKITWVGPHAALLDIAPESVPFFRLGGTIKLCKVLTHLPSTSWQDISNYLINNVPHHVTTLPAGKLKLGISVYNLTPSSKQISATGLSIKKACKLAGRSVRVIPNTDRDLNSAQVLHNRLTQELGMELVVVKSGNEIILAQTTAVQDIDAYAARDQKRPRRDARVGMLPPKLAQIIVNLATGNNSDAKLLDPFCGTGVLLQEALLMGFSVLGSDIEERMVEYTQENLHWLQTQYGQPGNVISLEVGDACSMDWRGAPSIIACETYLGRPFSTEPNREKLREIIQDVDTIHRKFLQNVSSQTNPGFRMCIAVPAWHTKGGVIHLPLLDQLTDMGYTRMSFVHSKNQDLIYHREGQIVGRELVVITRK